MVILTGLFTLITAPVVANRVGELAYREQNIRDDLLTRDEMRETGENGNPVPMTCTENDSWDITEGVGATALGVAWARAREVASQCPLFTDPYVQLFVDAAMERGWRLPPEQARSSASGRFRVTRPRARNGSTSLHRGGANGIEQASDPRRGSGCQGLAAAVVGRNRAGTRSTSPR